MADFCDTLGRGLLNPRVVKRSPRLYARDFFSLLLPDVISGMRPSLYIYIYCRSGIVLLSGSRCFLLFFLGAGLASFSVARPGSIGGGTIAIARFPRLIGSHAPALISINKFAGRRRRLIDPSRSRASFRFFPPFFAFVGRHRTGRRSGRLRPSSSSPAGH